MLGGIAGAIGGAQSQLFNALYGNINAPLQQDDPEPTYGHGGSGTVQAVGDNGLMGEPAQFAPGSQYGTKESALAASQASLATRQQNLNQPRTGTGPMTVQTTPLLDALSAAAPAGGGG